MDVLCAFETSCLDLECFLNLLTSLRGKTFWFSIFKRKLCDDKDDDEDDEDDTDDDDDNDNHHAGQGSIESHKEAPFPCLVPEKLQDRSLYEPRSTKMLRVLIVNYLLLLIIMTLKT